MYDESYAIVRSFKSKSKWMQQLSTLAPNAELFHEFMALKNAGKWHEGSFQDIYVPKFIHQIRYSQEAADVLNSIVERHQAGKHIALTCFCQNETLCHRSIIAGILQGHGEKVFTDTGTDYSRYYQLYLNA